ncbi:MAG: hypothetical protein ACOVRM_00950 [Planctomycetaceae bacterium]
MFIEIRGQTVQGQVCNIHVLVCCCGHEHAAVRLNLHRATAGTYQLQGCQTGPFNGLPERAFPRLLRSGEGIGGGCEELSDGSLTLFDFAASLLLLLGEELQSGRVITAVGVFRVVQQCKDPEVFFL